MHAYLNETQKEVKVVADRFAREVLAPRYMAREREESSIDRDILKQMGALGLLAPNTPVELGGMGLDCVTAGVICESIGYGDFNYGYMPLTTAFATQVLGAYARLKVRSEWIPRVLAGEALIGLGLTEPRGGSDAANLAMKAERRPGGWILNGEKHPSPWLTKRMRSSYWRGAARLRTGPGA